MIVFDLDIKKEEEMFAFLNYRKFLGLLEAFILGLPVVTRGAIINKSLTEADMGMLEDMFKDIMLCRPDAPKGKWGNLPRGRDCRISDINGFLKECQSKTSDACLLCFEHPSVYFTKKYVERHKISGAACVLIDWFKEITIECVGEGFDVGEITRGINLSHVAYRVDWNDANYPVDDIISRSSISTISSDKYVDTRKLRINQLSQWGAAPIDRLENSIPEISTGISKLQLKQIVDLCIRPVLKNIYICNIECYPTILINLYGITPHVFEFWYSDR